MLPKNALHKYFLGTKSNASIYKSILMKKDARIQGFCKVIGESDNSYKRRVDV